MTENKSKIELFDNSMLHSAAQENHNTKRIKMLKVLATACYPEVSEKSLLRGLMVWLKLAPLLF